MPDPVSWLQIGQGWNVVSSDGVIVGTVAQVEGDKSSDIFDGLAVESTVPARIRYVPGEKVGAIYPGEVTLTLAAADLDTLEPFQAPPPETTWRPGNPPLMTRISNWLRGGRRQVFGQELSAETSAVCRSDMMLRGQDASHIIFGNSFTDDGAKGRRFDYNRGIRWLR